MYAMIIFTNVGRLDNEELTFRRRALRDAVICVGWIKISSVLCYLIIFFMSFMNTSTTMGYTIQIMTLLPIVPQVVLAVLLFLGAVEQRVPVLQLAIWMCLVIGGYNALLGIIGFAYYIRTGYLTMHFLLALMFAILAVSIFAVLCNDILIIQSYKQVICPPVQTLTSDPCVVPT
ncbi:PREDICTED: uncharacterized protein LOC106108829 [Papilio polytes]|uniref:uncharacterized protein LOC106108829 n=1 Tax=Papilio polytes TaxID=76194 RepID=UPI0006760EDF|nr:PREDICTED: uncharacterized protein LOC106108829 [Papilio polytes]